LKDDNVGLAIGLLPYIGILTIYCLFTQVLNAALVGLGRLDVTNYIQSVARILILVTAVVLYSFGRGIESLVVGYSLSYLLIHIVSIIFIRKIADIHFIKFKYLDTKCMKTLLGFGGKVVTGQLLQIFISPFNKLMLSRYVGVATIPIYEIAYGSTMLVGSFLETGFRALMPEISRLSAIMTSEARARIKAITRKALKLILTVAFPGYFILFLGATMIFKVWLRDSFNEQIPYTFRVMLVGGFLFLLGLPFNNLLMGIGKVNYCLFAKCIQTAANIIIVIAVVGVNPLSLSRYIPYAVAGSMALWACYLLVIQQCTVQTWFAGKIT
jgi:O-antigen/teichoic acid export membrane protein